MLKLVFCSAQFLIEENGDIKWACLLIDPALFNTPMLPLDLGQKKKKNKKLEVKYIEIHLTLCPFSF